MAKRNTRQTGAAAASAAGKVLSSPKSSAADKSAAASNPRSVIYWLRRSPNAALLTRLAVDGGIITHELLDRLPPAHLVDMHATTAVRWANLATADWERYVAARAEDRRR